MQGADTDQVDQHASAEHDAEPLDIRLTLALGKPAGLAQDALRALHERAGAVDRGREQHGHVDIGEGRQRLIGERGEPDRQYRRWRCPDRRR